jgi:TetR/AcrR family transcriptional regulator
MGNSKRKEKRSATLRRILNAATSAFASGGFEGARMDDIARRAGVNKATIYYHVGDKKALYTAMLHDLFSAKAQEIAREVAKGGTRKEQLGLYVRCVTRTIKEHPFIPPIMLREVADGWKNFPELVIHDLLKIIEILKGIVEKDREYQQSPLVLPLVLHLMAIGPMLFFKNLEAALAKFTELSDVPINLPDIDAVASEVERLIVKAADE